MLHGKAARSGAPRSGMHRQWSFETMVWLEKEMEKDSAYRTVFIASALSQQPPIRAHRNQRLRQLLTDGESCPSQLWVMYAECILRRISRLYDLCILPSICFPFGPTMVVVRCISLSRRDPFDRHECCVVRLRRRQTFGHGTETRPECSESRRMRVEGPRKNTKKSEVKFQNFGRKAKTEQEFENRGTEQRTDFGNRRGPRT